MISYKNPALDHRFWIKTRHEWRHGGSHKRNRAFRTDEFLHPYLEKHESLCKNGAVQSSRGHCQHTAIFFTEDVPVLVALESTAFCDPKMFATRIARACEYLLLFHFVYATNKPLCIQFLESYLDRSAISEDFEYFASWPPTSLGLKTGNLEGQ